MCDFLVLGEFNFNLGAGAGATATFDANTWGPQVSTSTPVFYTTLLSLCATKAKTTSRETVATISSSKTSGGFFMDKRAGLTTTTLSTTEIYTGVSCKSSGLPNCPASLQTTLKSTSTLTLVTAIPSDSTAAFPAVTANFVPTTVPFGTGVHTLIALSGSPTSYVPSSSSTKTGSGSTGTVHSIGDGSPQGVPKKVIIGVSIGVGLPLIALAVGCCL